MSNPNETENQELADRLWQQQGKREDHAPRDWLEGEYRAHPPIVSAHAESDLRMRGLGYLTTGDPTDLGTTARPSGTKILPGASLVMAAGVLVGLGVLYSVFRRLCA